MKSRYIALLTLVLLPLSVYGQSGSINNTLGSGTFNILDGSGTIVQPQPDVWLSHFARHNRLNSWRDLLRRKQLYP